jgi:hypothetical protein
LEPFEEASRIRQAGFTRQGTFMIEQAGAIRSDCVRNVDPHHPTTPADQSCLGLLTRRKQVERIDE